MPTFEDLNKLTADPSLDDLEKGLSSGEIKPEELTDRAQLLLGLKKGEIKPEEISPRGLGAVFGKPYADIEKPKPIGQTITENIGRLMPQPDETLAKSPFAKYQGPPQTQKPTDIFIQPQVSPAHQALQFTKAVLHGALTLPEAFTQQLPYAEGLGERGKPLIPPVLGEITKGIYGTTPVKKVLEPITPEPGMAGQVGEIIGQLGAGAVLSMIPTLARAMRMKPTEVMQQVVAESKATNTPINEVVKNYLDQYQITGIPSTESQFNVPPKFAGTVTQPVATVTEPQLPPTVPEAVRQRIELGRMKPPKAGEEVPISVWKAPEVKPTEITPTEVTEPKSFRVTPEEVKGEIIPYREGMEEIKPPQPPPVEAKPTKVASTTQIPYTPEVSKQPWEMSKQEFDQAVARGKIQPATGKINAQEKAYGERPAKKQTALGWGEAAGYSGDDIAHFYAQRRGGGDIGREIGREELIADALAEGKPVPSEILNEYPNLKVTKQRKPKQIAIPPTQPEFSTGVKPIQQVTEDISTTPLYHGTTKSFKEFVDNPEGKEFDLLDRQLGTHLAVDPNVANSFAETEGGNVHKVYLNAKNIYTLPQRTDWGYKGNLELDQKAFANDIGAKVFPRRKDLFVNMYTKQNYRGYTPEQIGQVWDNIMSGKPAGIEDMEPWELPGFAGIVNNHGLLIWDKAIRSEFINEYKKALAEKGYDAIKYLNTAPMETKYTTQPVKDITTYVALKPKEQIQPAIGVKTPTGVKPSPITIGTPIEYKWGRYGQYRGKVLSEPYTLNSPGHIYNGTTVVDVSPEYMFKDGEWIRTAYGTPQGRNESYQLGVNEFTKQYPDAKTITETPTGVKEAPPPITEYHDLQGRPITKAGELIGPAKARAEARETLNQEQLKADKQEREGTLTSPEWFSQVRKAKGQYDKTIKQIEAQTQMENRITDIDTQLGELQKKLELSYGAEMEGASRADVRDVLHRQAKSAATREINKLGKRYGTPADIEGQITALENERADILKQVGIEPPTAAPEPPTVPTIMESTKAPGEKQPWEMTREQFANPDLKERVLSREEFVKQYTTEKDKYTGTPLGQHYNPETNTVVVEQGASDWVRSHEKAHSYSEQVAQNPIWEQSIDATPGAGEALAEWDRTAKKAGGGFVGKGKGMDNNPANPRNYDWRETSADIISDYFNNKLSLPLRMVVEDVGASFPETRLGQLVQHKGIVQEALSEGKPVPPEVLKDYPDLQKPSLVKRLITEEKGGLTIGGRREELLGKLGEPIELPEKAVNINLKNLNTPDDVKGLITQIGKLYEPDINEARRGVITNQQTAKLADDLGMSVEDLLKRQLGKAYNAEELLGARRLLTFAGEEAYTKAQIAASNPSNENMTDALSSMLNAIAVQKQVSGATAEAGRALQSAKILAGPAVAREQAMKRIIAQMGGQELTQEILARLGSLDISNPLAVNRFLRDISKARTSDKVYEVWLNALLSKPTTHMANDLSNLTTMLVRPFEELGAAIAEVPRAAFTGTPRERFFGEPFADIVGMTQGLKDAATAFVQSVATEEPAFIKSTKIETLPRFIGGKAIKGPIGRGIRTPTTLLQAEDDFFKAWNYRGKLNALAYREAAKQGTGLKGMAEILSNVPTWMDEQARGEAVYRTFQQELGPQGKALMQFRDRVPGLRYIIPFLRTPTNILKFSLERTPLNLPRIATQAIKGQIAGGKVSEEMAKIMVGSAIGYLTTRYALEGKVTGGGPSSPGERKAWLMTNQPYSIKVGDHWIGYGRLEPIASIIGMSADLAELWKKMDTEDAVAKIGMAIAKNFTSKTFMTGISDVVKAIEDPENAGEKWITRLAGTAVPAVVAGAAQTVDPTIRRPENFLQGIEARIPGLSANIPPLRDIWGRPIIMQETGPERFISPIRRMEIPDDKATSEYVRLGLSASTAGKSFGKIDILSEDYQRYLEQGGAAAHKAVSKLVERPFYNRLNDMQKSELIKKAMENARKPYRAKMKLETWRRFKAEGGTMKEFMAESRGYSSESLQRTGGE